jgi:hypothetical protein
MENVTPQPNHAAPAGRRSHKPGKKHIKKIVAAFVIIFVVSGLVVGGLMAFQSSISANINSSKYQAVFLTSGQVYFGKMTPINGGYVKLTDIFYPQTAATDTTNPQSATSDAADIQLIKLGNEIHGPEDGMIINRDQILFFENLKSDGKVSQTITNYNKPQ